MSGHTSVISFPAPSFFCLRVAAGTSRFPTRSITPSGCSKRSSATPRERRVGKNPTPQKRTKVSSSNTPTLLNTVTTLAPGASQDTLLSRSVHYFRLRDYEGKPFTIDSPAVADPDAPTGEGITNPETVGGKTRYLSTKTYD